MMIVRVVQQRLLDLKANRWALVASSRIWEGISRSLHQPSKKVPQSGSPVNLIMGSPRATVGVRW